MVSLISNKFYKIITLSNLNTLGTLSTLNAYFLPFPKKINRHTQQNND